MKKLHFNSTLNHKASDYKPYEICVERIITLYGKSFEQLKANPMRDNPYITEYCDLMYMDAYRGDSDFNPSMDADGDGTVDQGNLDAFVALYTPLPMQRSHSITSMQTVN